jgi:serine/threonine protein kinase
MIGEFGEVLVMDWGVAAVGRREGASPSGLVFGTPAYMSPEQAFGRGEQITERTDVYGLGGVLHFLLTGRAPSAARTAEEARGIFEGGGPGAVIEAPVAKPLRAICRKALAADPLERYAGPLELSADLVRFESALPVSAYRETVLERAGRWISRYRVPILLVGAYLFIRVLLLLLGGR